MSGERLFVVTEGSLTDVFVADANKDGATDVASMRTLGTGATQAAAGDHTHAGVLLADGDYGDIVVSSSGTVISIDSGVATAAGRALMDDVSASAQRTTLGLGTAALVDTGTGAANVPTTAAADLRYQPLDSDLTSLAALGSAADKLAYTTGAHAWAEAALTSAGRALIDDADAAAQRTTLGLGTAATTAATDYQPVDAELTALAALSSSAGILRQTGAAAFAKLSDTVAGRALLEAADVAAQITALGLAALYQPLDSDLTSLAALGSAADKLAYTTAAHTWAEASITTQGRALIDDATAGDQLTTLGITAAAQTILDDASVAAILATLGGAPLASPTFTGTPAAPTAAAATNTTQLATTAFVTTADNLKANLASPAFTGVPTAPVIVLATTTPSAPSAGNVAIDAVSVGGRMTPAVTPPVGALYALEPSLGQGRLIRWITIGNTTSAPTGEGIAAPAQTGTATQRDVATTNLFTMSKRWGLISGTSTAGSSMSLRASVLQFALYGGFSFVCRFGIADAAAVANARFFVGFVSVITQLTNAEPSTSLNMFGVGCEAGQTTMRTYSNDGSGTATMANLGANFPVDTRSTDLYELAMFCVPGGSTVYYVVTRLNTGNVASGSWSSDLPASTVLLAPQIWRNNGTTALAVGMDFVSLYIRTDT